MILVSKVWFAGMLNPFHGSKISFIITNIQKRRWLPILTQILKKRHAKFLINWFATGFNCNICLYNKLKHKWQFGDKWPPRGYFFKCWWREIIKSLNYVFHCRAPIYHRFTISNFKCMFMRVIHLNKLVVIKRVLLSGGIKIQDGCQS